MIRNHNRLILTLLVVGLIALRWVSTPLYTLPTFTPPDSALTPSPTDGTIAPAIVHGFDGDRPIGLDLLNQQLEVLFDH